MNQFKERRSKVFQYVRTYEQISLSQKLAINIIRRVNAISPTPYMFDAPNVPNPNVQP